MANPGQGKYSLPEELHRYVLEQPQHVLAPDIPSSSQAGPSSPAFGRQRSSYSPSPNPVSLTPAVFPSDEGGDRLLSPQDSEEPDDESGSYSTSPSRRPIGEDMGASSMPQMAMAGSLSRGEMGFSHLVQHSYTIPPPVPPLYPVPGAQEWRPRGEGHLGPWPSHGGRESSHALEGRAVGGERYEIPPGGRTYEMARTGYYSRTYEEDSGQMAGPSHQAYGEPPRMVRPPPHYPDSHYGRGYVPGGEEYWSRDPTSRTGGSGHDVMSTERVVLPPVSALLGEIGARGSHEYEAPVLPRLRVPEEAGEIRVRMGRDRDRPEGRESAEEEAASSSAKSRGRGKKRQTGETEEEQSKKTKVIHKIYVACDFCRGKTHSTPTSLFPLLKRWVGRKLRCDGSKPSCANCATRSLECKYQDHPRRRGPGKAPKGSRKGEGKGKKAPGRPSESGDDGFSQYQFSAGSSSRAESKDDPP